MKLIKRGNIKLYVITTSIADKLHYFEGITSFQAKNENGASSTPFFHNVWIPDFQHALVFPGRNCANKWLSMVGIDGVSIKAIGFFDKQSKEIVLAKDVDNSLYPNKIILDNSLMRIVHNDTNLIDFVKVKLSNIVPGDFFKLSENELHLKRADYVRDGMIHWHNFNVSGVDKKTLNAGSISISERPVLKIKQNYIICQKKR